jgi:hypothetical protein
VARLAIDKDFLDDYSKLPKPVQNAVKMAIDRFAEHVHAGLHLEKLPYRHVIIDEAQGSTTTTSPWHTSASTSAGAAGGSPLTTAPPRRSSRSPSPRSERHA